MKYVSAQVTRHGKRIYYFRKGREGRRVRLPDEYGTPEFLEAYKAAYREITYGVPRRVEKQREAARNKRRIEKSLTKSICGAKQRAKKRGLPFDIRIEWALDEVEANGFCCALTGIEFFSEEFGPVARAFTPSIDRIDSSKGYTKDNCRIVLLAVNIMLMDWGQDVFEMIAKAYRERNGITNAEKIRLFALTLKKPALTKNKTKQTQELKAAN